MCISYLSLSLSLFFFFLNKHFYEGFCTRTVPYMSSYNMAHTKKSEYKKHLKVWDTIKSLSKLTAVQVVH